MHIYEKGKENTDLANKSFEYIVKKFNSDRDVLGWLKTDDIFAALMPTITAKGTRPSSAIFLTEKYIYVYNSLAVFDSNKKLYHFSYSDFKDLSVSTGFLNKIIIETYKQNYKFESAISQQEKECVSKFKRLILNTIEDQKKVDEEIDDDIVLPDINLDINTVLDNGNSIKITDYKESLKTGGTLIIEPSGYRIYYYFPGPDLRYNGEMYNIYGSEINKYISALKTNFAKYIELKEKLKTEHITCEGELGMSININQRHEGVCLFPYRMNISTQKQLDKLIHDFKYAKARAKQVRELMTRIKKGQQ